MLTKYAELVLIVGLGLLTLYPTDGAQKINVTEEVNRMAAKFEQFEKPSPSMINAVMEQFQESCRTNRTFNDTDLAKGIGECMDGTFNETLLVKELQDAIPKGNLDNVFRNICLKWPTVKNCLKPAFDIVEECWGNGTMVTNGVETMVKFFCGDNNDGALIALFFAEGGLTCLEGNGDKVRDCINEHNTEENQEDFCKSVQQIHDCLAPLRKCDDVTPHNLVSSMMRQVGKVTGCAPIQEKIVKGGSSSNPRVHLGVIAALTSLLLFFP